MTYRSFLGRSYDWLRSTDDLVARLAGLHATLTARLTLRKSLV